MLNRRELRKGNLFPAGAGVILFHKVKRSKKLAVPRRGGGDP